jgi:hypothetical protein
MLFVLIFILKFAATIYIKKIDEILCYDISIVEQNKKRK